MEFSEDFLERAQGRRKLRIPTAEVAEKEGEIRVHALFVATRFIELGRKVSRDSVRAAGLFLAQPHREGVALRLLALGAVERIGEILEKAGWL